MTSFLENQLRQAIAKGFKNKLLTGTLERAVSSSVNEYGDTVDGTPSIFRIEGFIDNYTAFYRAQAGIPEGDSKVILILGNCETDPKKDDVIKFNNRPNMRIREVSFDPALAHAECQSFEIP